MRKKRDKVGKGSVDYQGKVYKRNSLFDQVDSTSNNIH